MTTQAQTLRAPTNVLVFPDPETLTRALTEDLAQHIRAAVAAKGVCHCVFPGGRSPRRVLELLYEQPTRWYLDSASAGVMNDNADNQILRIKGTLN